MNNIKLCDNTIKAKLEFANASKKYNNTITDIQNKCEHSKYITIEREGYTTQILGIPIPTIRVCTNCGFPEKGPIFKILKNKLIVKVNDKTIQKYLIE
jgi:hypothetical protein